MGLHDRFVPEAPWAKLEQAAVESAPLFDIFVHLSNPPDLLAGRYRMLSPLGAGGMGEVFLAEDTRLERRVAVKLLPASAAEDAVARERLRREALAAAALDHPFICKVYEIGDADGRFFIVMEYVEGETLQAFSHRSLLPLRHVIDIAHELAQALDAAHRRGILHRDLKPANVMVTPQGHVKVLDFGLAKHVAMQSVAKLVNQSGDGSTTIAGRDDAALTDAGTRLGTPAYMSPEQVLGAPLDARSDLFSLGVILHELATGRHPFLGDDPVQTMSAILRDGPATGSRDAEEIIGFGIVIGRLLAKACAERHQTTAELLTDIDALRSRAWSSSSHAPAAKAEALPERTPFVGRDNEAAELSRMLDRMLTGQGGLVLVGGEPGVGKTRLARELLAEARRRGCLCLTGHCYEMEGAPPFVPFVESTEQAARLVPRAVRAAMGDLAPEIAAMVPSLRRMYSDIPSLPDVPGDQRRRLMFSAFLEYVQRGTQKSPGVILLDDLHWADEGTLQLLLHVAQHLASMRLLVVGTYRDVELDVVRPFAKALESLLRQRLAMRIALRRLNESGVQEMLTRMGGSTPPSGLTKAVFRETEGNPFFVEEVYQHLSEEGKLFEASGAWKADLRVDSIEVPEGVRLVIGRRLERLGETARRVLTAGAVIGRTFPLDLLLAVIDYSEDDVLDAIEETERAHLVSAEAGQRTARYGFVHELIRTTLVNALSLPRRQRLHLKIADAVERLRAASLESHASVLAHHLYQAGAAADAPRTARALTLAGRRAMAAAAFEEALEIYENLIGLELTDQDPLVAAAWEHRGYALNALGRHDESVSAFDRALTLSGAAGDDAGVERAAFGESNVYGWLGRTGEGLEALRRGLNALSSGALRERALLLAWSAAFRLSPAHLDDAAEQMAAATAIAAELDDPIVARRVAIAQGASLRMSCEYESALATARTALQLTSPDALWDRADVLTELVMDEYYLGHLDACDQWLRQLRTAAEPAGHRGALFLAAWFPSQIAFMRTGNVREYLATSTRLAELPNIKYAAHGAVGQACLYLGQVDRAFEQLSLAVKMMPPHNWFQGMPESNLFAATALAGRHDHAKALTATVRPWLPAPARRNVQGSFYALDAFVIGLAALGDRDQCAALYPLTLDYLRTGQVVAALVVGPSAPPLAAALAAEAAGLAERAREHFETALQQVREVPMRPVEPAVLYWYGRALCSRSEEAERARGRAMIETALADFQKLEMVLHANLAEQFLRQAGSA
jgi:serine/threonine protein kinase/tetratricopeptide (TPR) repeat protein